MSDVVTIVLLSCGHWFRERRPDGLADPVDGERRVCGSPDHYPSTSPAVYLPNRTLGTFLGVSHGALDD